jgi:hypothetical protein
MQLCQLEKVCTPLWISPVKLLGTNIQDGAMAREGKEVYQYRPLLSKAIRNALNEAASETISDCS